MRQLPLSAALLTFLDELEFTEAALSADEETADLAKLFAEQIELWETTFKAERVTRRAVTRAEAVVALRNAKLDAHTTKFGASVLAESGGDRKSPFFRRFFTVAPSAFVRQPLRKQCELTLHVMAAEIGKLDKHHPLKSFASSLTGLATLALTALETRTKAKAERAVASNDVDEWKEGVNTLRLSTYAELLKIAADKAYGKAWVEAFFRVETTGGTGEDAAEPLPAAGNASAGSSSAHADG
jgi:hypothetical protein